MSVSRIILAIALLLHGGWAFAGPTQVEGVRIASGPDRTRVALDLSQPSRHKMFTLSNPDRVVIDISPGRIVRQALPLPAGEGAVRQIRTANRSDGSVRVVLDLRHPVRPNSFMLAADGRRADRLVIDLHAAGGTAYVRNTPLKAPRSPVPPPASVAAQPAPTPAAKAKAVPAPAAPSRPSPKVAAPAPVRQLPSGTPGRDVVVAIDPGHGGKDPGARGPTGKLEKDVVLGISRRLADEINKQPGMRALLTRSDDRFVNLRQRMEHARKSKADLFISVHADAFRDRRVRGATVYVLSDKGATDEAARRLAQRENAAALVGGVDLASKDDTLASVLMDLSQNASMSASFSVGQEIIDELGGLTKVRKRKVQQAPFLVLKSPDVPSILVETAYISNPQDEKNLASSSYQARMAAAISNGVRDYFHANPPEGTRLAEMARTGQRGSVAHVIQRGDTLSEIASRYNVSMQRIRSQNRLPNDRVRIGQIIQIPPTQDI